MCMWHISTYSSCVCLCVTHFPDIQKHCSSFFNTIYANSKNGGNEERDRKERAEGEEWRWGVCGNGESFKRISKNTPLKCPTKIYALDRQTI